MALIVVSCRGSNAAGYIPVIQDWSEDVTKEAVGTLTKLTFVFGDRM